MQVLVLAQILRQQGCEALRMRQQLALHIQSRSQIGRSQSSEQHINDTSGAEPHHWQNAGVHISCQLELRLLLSHIVRDCGCNSAWHGHGGPHAGSSGTCAPFNAG